MHNKRKHKRFELAEDMMFADQLTNPYCYYGGQTINYSMDGICLTSRYEVTFGDSLCLRMIGKHLQSCTSVDGLTCLGEVKWCQSISSSGEPAYYIGLNYFGQVPDLFKPDHYQRSTSAKRYAGYIIILFSTISVADKLSCQVIKALFQ